MPSFIKCAGLVTGRFAGPFACVIVCAFNAACSTPTPTGPTPVPVARPSSAPPHTPSVPVLDIEAVLVGAGDIGWCGADGNPQATARLLDSVPGTVFTTGDNAYMTGSADNFRQCYNPAWGRHLSRTRPTPGNHDYETPGAAGYFSYFGANAGSSGLGYYSYQAGAWLVLALNSEVPAAMGSAQLAWVRHELTATPTRCALAYFHHPLFGSGTNGSDPRMRDAWRELYDLGVDVVLSGHSHSYERFAPQDPDGRFDPQRGIREFVVGTGGAPLTGFPRVQANSEVRSSTWGVLKLTLRPTAYAWEFVPVPGQAFMDSGTANCS
jgi:acid phosphatase type 7